MSHGKDGICVQNLAVDEEVTRLLHHYFVLFFLQGASSFKAEKPRNKCVRSFSDRRCVTVRNQLQTVLSDPDRELVTDQSMNSIEVQLGEPGFLLGSHRGAEMTHRQLHPPSLPQHGCQLTKLGTWSTLHSLQAAQHVRVSFPSDSVGPNLFQAAALA